MNSRSSVLARFSAIHLFLLCACTVSAQEAPPAALRFVNATGIEEPLLIVVNGDRLQSRGYSSGSATGRLHLPATPCRIELSHTELGRHNFTLDLQAGVEHIVVAHTVAETGNGVHPLKFRLEHQVLNPSPGESTGKSRLQLLQTTMQAHLELRLAGTPLRLARLRPETLELPSTNSEIGVYHGDLLLGRLPFSEPGHGTVILFTDTAGHLHHVFFLEPGTAEESSDRR